MSEALLYNRQRNWFRDLMQQVKDRTQSEAATESVFRAGKERAEKEIQATRKTLAQRRAKDLAAAEANLQEALSAATAKCEADCLAADKELAEAKVRLLHEFDDAELQAKNALQEAQVSATSFFEAGEAESMEKNLKHQRKTRDAL